MGKPKKVVVSARGVQRPKGVIGDQPLGVNDVLFGRGTGISSYRGNINFRCIVLEYKVGALWNAVLMCRVSLATLAWRMRVLRLFESHGALLDGFRKLSTDIIVLAAYKCITIYSKLTTMANATRNASLRRRLLVESVTLTLLVDFSSSGKTRRSTTFVAITEFGRKPARRFERNLVDHLLCLS